MPFVYFFNWPLKNLKLYMLFIFPNRTALSYKTEGDETSVEKYMIKYLSKICLQWLSCFESIRQNVRPLRADICLSYSLLNSKCRCSFGINEGYILTYSNKNMGGSIRQPRLCHSLSKLQRISTVILTCKMEIIYTQTDYFKD